MDQPVGPTGGVSDGQRYPRSGEYLRIDFLRIDGSQTTKGLFRIEKINESGRFWTISVAVVLQRSVVTLHLLEHHFEDFLVFRKFKIVGLHGVQPTPNESLLLDVIDQVHHHSIRSWGQNLTPEFRRFRDL